MGAVTPEEASALVARDVRRTDRSIDGYLSELILYLERRLFQELSDFPIAGAGLTQRETLRILGGMESIIFTGSLEEKIALVQDLFDLQEQLSQATFEAATGRVARGLSRDTRRELGIFATSRDAAVRVAISQYLANVREQVVESIVANRQLVLSDVLERAGARVFADLKVKLQTDLSTYARLGKIERGMSAGYVYFIYAGPRDDRNRPFCAERANNVYHINDIYGWENGQLEPPWVYCGGYNCRHELIPTDVPEGLPTAKERPASGPPEG